MSLSDAEWGKLIRWGSSIFMSFMIFWGASGWIIEPIVTAYAKETFRELLQEDTAFSKLKRESEENAEKIDNLDRDVEGIKRSIDRVILQTDGLEKTGNETKALIQKLLDIQLGLPPRR